MIGSKHVINRGYAGSCAVSDLNDTEKIHYIGISWLADPAFFGLFNASWDIARVDNAYSVLALFNA